MVMRSLAYLLLSLLIIVFAGCGEVKKKKDFQLNIILSEPLAKSSDDPMPSFFDKLIRYYFADSICKDTVFVPRVFFIREDLGGEKEEYTVPLSKLNNFRNSLGMLPADNLMEDYNTAKLKSPQLLCKKSPPGIVSDSFDKDIPNLIEIDKRYFTDSGHIVKDRIFQLIASGDSKGEVNLRITRYKKPEISADSAYSAYKLKSIQPGFASQELDSMLIELERKYPNYYLFTFERFKRSVCGSKLKSSDTLLIKQIIAKAIKYDQVQAMKDSMKYLRRTCKIQGRTRSEKPVKTPSQTKESKLLEEIIIIITDDWKEEVTINIRQNCLDENWLNQITLENKLQILAEGQGITDNCKMKINAHLKSVTAPNAKVLVVARDGSVLQNYNAITYYNRVLMLGKRMVINVVSSQTDGRRKYTEIKLHEE